MTSPGRSWRLLAYDAANKLVHDRVCQGDRALDAAMKPLELNPDIKRLAVQPA